MKKILIMLSMIAVFACLFAISAFAATEIDGIWYDLSGSGENAVAKVTNKNVDCKLETVIIPETVTYNDVTYTVTEINYHAFSGEQSSWKGNQTIKKVVIPATVNKIGAHIFRNCGSLEEVTIYARNENGIALADAEFYNCTSLISVDMSESDITSFNQYTFSYCKKLTTVKYPPRLKTIGGQCFRGCSSLTSGDLSGTLLETISNWGMGDCTSLPELKLPTTFKSISSNALQNCTITKLIFPHTFTTLGDDSIPFCKQLYLMVLPAIVTDSTSIHSGALHDSHPKVVIYSGDTYDHLTGTGKLFASYKVEPFSNFDPTKTYTEKTFFYGADTCERCNGLLGEEYFDFNGFSNGMYIKSNCINCDKENIIEDLGTMIKCLGYSTPENGRGGIAIGFEVDKKAIDIYEEKTGKSVDFGAFAIAQKNLGDNYVLDNDGSAISGAIKAEISNTQIGSFELVITGFKTEVQKAAMLAIGAYVIATKGEEIEISYIQKGTPSEGNKYCFISYNQLN